MNQAHWNSISSLWSSDEKCENGNISNANSSFMPLFQKFIFWSPVKIVSEIFDYQIAIYHRALSCFVCASQKWWQFNQLSQIIMFEHTRSLGYQLSAHIPFIYEFLVVKSSNTYHFTISTGFVIAY